MIKPINYNETIKRIGFFLDKKNLSARSLSLKLGRSEQYMKRILSKKVELKVKTLFDIFEILDITALDFFYLGKEYNKNDKQMLEMFNQLSNESKQTIFNLMQQLR